LTKAFDVIKRATDKDEWERLIEKRRQDLLVYIALSHFDKRPRFTYLPAIIQHDIKALFGNYTNACREADKLLFDLGQPNVLAKACKNSEIGKFVGNALYVHVSALDSLSPSLRLYEGCASRAFGKIDKVTIVKLRADKPAISYLYYPEFDTDPHPALQLSMRADLKSLYVGYSDYSKVDNPPILHRKETFVTYDYPLYEEFARLTAQEENWGLLDDPTTIGTRRGWTERLQRSKVKLQGHQLFRLSDAIS
jgi:DNA phosphorothioation-associated putative methyltransferase